MKQVLDGIIFHKVLKVWLEVEESIKPFVISVLTQSYKGLVEKELR